MKTRFKSLGTGKTRPIVAAVAFAVACTNEPMTEPKLDLDMGKPTVDMEKPGQCGNTGTKSKLEQNDKNGILLAERYILKLDSINGREAHFIIYDPYSDYYGIRLTSAAINEGTYQDVIVPGNLGTSGKVTIEVIKISENATDIIACAKLPSPLMCDATKEEVKNATLGKGENIQLNGNYKMTFEKVDRWIDGVGIGAELRLNDLSMVAGQNFILVKNNTQVDFAYGNAVLVINVTELVASNPSVKVTACAKNID